MADEKPEWQRDLEADLSRLETTCYATSKYVLASLVVAIWWGLIVLFWVGLVLLVLSLLREFGFSPWTIDDVVQVATAWPSAIMFTLLAIVILLLKPLAELLSRVSDFEWKGTSGRAKFRDPRDTTLTEGVSIRFGRFEPSLASTKNEPPDDAPDEPQFPLSTEGPVEAGPKPEETTTKTEPKGNFPSVLKDITDEQREELLAWMKSFHLPISSQDLAEKLISVPQMRLSNYTELDHARLILSDSGLATVPFVDALVADKEVASFLNSALSGIVGRSPEKAIDPVSFCSWGALLAKERMSFDAREKVIREIYDAKAKGILKP